MEIDEYLEFSIPIIGLLLTAAGGIWAFNIISHGVDKSIMNRAKRIVFLSWILFFILIIIYVVHKEVQIYEVKSEITAFLQFKDKSGPTKLISELKLVEHLVFLKYDDLIYRKAMLRMLRNRELLYIKKELDSKEFNKTYEVRFFFLSREFTDKLQNATQ